MMKYSKLIVCALTLVSGVAVAEQSCVGKSPTAEASSFVLSTDIVGKALHTTSGLEWSRCLVGQSWNETESTCEGAAVKLTWQDALLLANTYDFGEHTDWRVPNLKELTSLVQRACVSPAIDLTVFPATLTGGYWTSTPNTSADRAMEAWSVNFLNGRIESREKQQDYYVRMVRYAE